MEEFRWNTLFQNEIKDQGINHMWSFCMDEHLQAQQGYLQYTQSTFARFQCSHCSREWNSAQVHILFLIRWDRTYRRGSVKMRIFRQACRRCTVCFLQKPEITKENIQRVISNLVSKIQSMVYGKNNISPPLAPVIYSDDVEGPHDKKHCEACKMKVCPCNSAHGEKTKVTKPQSVKFLPWASSAVQVKDKKINIPTYTHVPSRPTTAVHQSPDNENVICFLIIILIVFGLLIIITKQ